MQYVSYNIPNDTDDVKTGDHVENVELLHQYCYQCRRSRVRHSSDARGQIGILYSDWVLWS